MANALTGDYEAVVQVSVRQINGLLATLHQNGASEDAPLKLLHSATVRVGDRRPKPTDILVGDFGDWVREYQRVWGLVGLGNLRTHLTQIAPPGAARMIEDFFSKIGQVVVTETPPATVRGMVRVQLASPTLSLSSGSTSEVTVHVSIRAHYYPDADTDPMPEPVHGEVQATFEVRQVSSPQRGSPRRLLIHPSSQDSKIQFIAAPGTGLSDADVGRISAQVRKAVRDSFTLLPVDLPADFAFSDFKGLGSGSGQALALPIQLSGGSLPPGGIQSVNNLFIGPSGFAFAVSEEFVKTVFQPTLDSLRQIQGDFTVTIGWPPLGSTAHYHYSVIDAYLQFNDGSIDLIVKAKATTGTWNPLFPDYNNIVITQRLILHLFLGILIIDNDELTISGAGRGTDTVRSFVIHARDQRLPGAQNAFNQELSDAKTRLDNALRSFDSSASATFRAGSSTDAGSSSSGAIAITPDGVIVRGNIGSTTGRNAPIVDIAETDQRSAFTALESWIPGGRIDTLMWSWVGYSGPITSIWAGGTKTETQTHRFILAKPPGVTEISSICLRIEGTQTLPDGQVVSVAGGTTCHVPDFGLTLEAPSWWEPVTLPIWSPDSTAGAILKDVVAGHISVQSATPQNGLAHNSLVYFADWRADKPLAALDQALAQMRRKGFSLVVIVVLPAGAFDSRRREVEAKLGPTAERLPARLLLTEDHEGGWTRTFALSKTPSTYLINARREFAWKHEGAADPKMLAAALDEHLVPAPAPRSRPLRLAVSPGDRAPDVSFEDDRGQGFALHRLRGREVLLNFWQSWSEPCIKELRRLQQMQHHAGARGPLIVAFHGGKDRKILEEIRKRHGLSFSLVHDADQVIARRYGVRCWPTTVSVNAAGLVGHVQFGVQHEHEPASGRKEARS